jgi:transcriptional regulator with XRE-family HTH domain
MSPRAKSLGEEIRSARVTKGLGLREFARLLEKAPSYVSDIEYDRRVPSEQVLRAICKHLDLDFDRALALAGRLGDDADRYLKREPAAGVLLRRAQETGLGEEELKKLIQQVDRLARKRPDAE